MPDEAPDTWKLNRLVHCLLLSHPTSSPTAPLRPPTALLQFCLSHVPRPKSHPSQFKPLYSLYIMRYTASFQDFQRFHKFRRTTQFPLDPYVTSLYHLHSRHQFPIRNYYGHVIEQHRILHNGSRSCKPFNPRRPRFRPLHRSPTHATTPSISQLTPNLHTALPIDLVLPCLSR